MQYPVNRTHTGHLDLSLPHAQLVQRTHSPLAILSLLQLVYVRRASWDHLEVLVTVSVKQALRRGQAMGLPNVINVVQARQDLNGRSGLYTVSSQLVFSPIRADNCDIVLVQAGVYLEQFYESV